MIGEQFVFDTAFKRGGKGADALYRLNIVIQVGDERCVNYHRNSETVGFFYIKQYSLVVHTDKSFVGIRVPKLYVGIENVGLFEYLGIIVYHTRLNGGLDTRLSAFVEQGGEKFSLHKRLSA